MLTPQELKPWLAALVDMTPTDAVRTAISVCVPYRPENQCLLQSIDVQWSTTLDLNGVPTNCAITATVPDGIETVHVLAKLSSVSDSDGLPVTVL